MAAVQIDEAQLRQLQQLAATVGAISSDPEARLLLQRAQKKALPTSNIPDLDRHESEETRWRSVESKIDKFISDQEARSAEAESRRQQDEFAAQWNRQKSALREQGFLDDTIDRIEKHAQENGIANLRAAANDFLALNPPPPPADSRTFGGWSMFADQASSDNGDKFMKAMIDSQGNNDAAVDAEAWAAINEFREATKPARWGR